MMGSPPSGKSSFWRRDGVFLVLLSLVFGLRYLPSFFNGNLFGLFQDGVWLFGPMFSRASFIASHHNCPYWLDTILGGFPIYNTPHFSITYPLYFLGALDYGIELDAVATLSRLTLFHLFILSINSYIMLRAARAGGLGALCGAVVALINGTTTGYSSWTEVIASYSWFPLIIAGAILVLRRPGVASTLLLSVSSALLTLANPAQPIVHALIFCLAFFLFGLIWIYKTSGFGHVCRVMACLVTALLISFGLTAVATIPVALDIGNTIRHLGLRDLSVVGHQKIPWEAFRQHQLALSDLSHVLFGSQSLDIIGGPYVGPLGVVGVVLCWLGFRWGDSLRRFLIIVATVLALYGLLAGLGTVFGITQLHYHLPLLNRIREAGRHLVFFTTFVSLLAGLGFDLAFRRVATNPFQRESWGPRQGTILILAGGSLAFIAELVSARGSHNDHWWSLLAIPIGLMLFRLCAIPINAISTAGLSFSCLAAVVANDGTLPPHFSSYYDSSNLKALRVIRRLAELPGIKSSRVAFRDSTFSPSFWAMNASFYGIRSFYAFITPSPYNQFQEMNREYLPHYRELMGAKYVVCGQNLPPRSSTDKLLFQESGYRVYETARTMAETTLIHQIGGSYANDAQFLPIISRGFDYDQTAYVPAESYQQIAQFLRASNIPSPQPRPDFIELTANDFNQRVIAIETQRPALLVLNEHYNPAWHVVVNGVVRPLLRVNLHQIAVELHPGRALVEFYYKPVFFSWLHLLQVITCGAIVSAGVMLLFLRREGRQSTTSPRPARSDRRNLGEVVDRLVHWRV